MTRQLAILGVLISLGAAACGQEAPAPATGSNSGASSSTMTVGVGSAPSQALYQFAVPSHGWATLRVAP